MIAPAVQSGVSTIQLFGGRPSFAGKPTNISDGTVWEKQLIHHSGLGWRTAHQRQT